MAGLGHSLGEQACPLCPPPLPGMPAATYLKRYLLQHCGWHHPTDGQDARFCSVCELDVPKSSDYFHDLQCGGLPPRQPTGEVSVAPMECDVAEQHQHVAGQPGVEGGAAAGGSGIANGAAAADLEQVGLHVPLVCIHQLLCLPSSRFYYYDATPLRRKLAVAMMTTRAMVHLSQRLT